MRVRAAARRDQAGAILAGQQVAAVLVGEDAGGIVDAAQVSIKACSAGRAAAFVGRAGLFELESEQAAVSARRSLSG